MMTDLNPDEWDWNEMESALWETNFGFHLNIIAWARFCWWLAR